MCIRDRCIARFVSAWWSVTFSTRRPGCSSLRVTWVTVSYTHLDVYKRQAEALRVAPGLADASIGEVKVGLRPSSPDLLPILGHIPTVQNAFLATGHGASGLQLGPYSGKLVAELALGREPANSLHAFSCDRFPA